MQAAFLDNARALLQNADEAVTKARAVASAEPTELHVGYSPTPTAEILPKTLRAFQRAMPNVCGSISQCCDATAQGRVIRLPKSVGRRSEFRFVFVNHQRDVGLTLIMGRKDRH